MNLVSENEFSGASGVFQQLAGQTFCRGVTKLVDNLKEQIQRALAGGAVGNLSKK